MMIASFVMALFLSTLTTLARIKTVHVINSCHLDIGFADSAAGIINRYFDHHLPMAATVGAELAKGVEGFTDDKLSFMFQSWVLDLYFDCPPAMGVHCPSAEAMASVRTAIAAGHITWHAFPHNAQLEIMGEAMIDAGLELTFALDKRFGLPNKTTLSQRDVPGMPRALCVSWNRPQDQFQPSDAAPPFAATLPPVRSRVRRIPILKRKGVSAISVGANDGSTPPDLPPCFLWRDAASGESLIGLLTWPGYGELPLTHQTRCVVEGLEHALVYNWNVSVSATQTLL